MEETPSSLPLPAQTLSADLPTLACGSGVCKKQSDHHQFSRNNLGIVEQESATPQLSPIAKHK